MIISKIKTLLSKLKNSKIAAGLLLLAMIAAPSAIQLPVQTLGMVIILYLWSDLKKENKSITKELNLYKTYKSSDEEETRSFRMCQHEFNNHINTILCLTYITSSHEELKSELQSYCTSIVQQNKPNRIVKYDTEPIINALLYSKIGLANKYGIDVDCVIYPIDTKKILETYDLVEILGILLDNAIEALRESGGKKIVVKIISNEMKQLVVEVANISRTYKNAELEKFCAYGYSSKGEGRGLGLARLKVLIDKNGAVLLIQNTIIKSEVYLSFIIIFKKC